MTVSRLDAKETPRRFCCPYDHFRERENDTDQYTIDRAKHQHADKCSDKDEKFRPRYLPESCRKFKFRCSKKRRNHDCCQHRNGKITDKSGSAKKYNDHRKARDDSRQLRFRLILLPHCSARHGSVDRAAAGKCSQKISHGKSKYLLIVIHLIAIFLCEIVLCKKCLCHNHDRYGQTDRDGFLHRDQRQIRKFPCRKPWFHHT